MNFNVYIDKPTGERLARLARARRTSRNALIREALANLLVRDSYTGWPQAVLDFRGMPAVRPFEDARQALKAPSEDPLV